MTDGKLQLEDVSYELKISVACVLFGLCFAATSVVVFTTTEKKKEQKNAVDSPGNISFSDVFELMLILFDGWESGL